MERFKVDARTYPIVIEFDDVDDRFYEHYVLVHRKPPTEEFINFIRSCTIDGVANVADASSYINIYINVDVQPDKLNEVAGILKVRLEEQWKW